jgi:hypothetical protein
MKFFGKDNSFVLSLYASESFKMQKVGSRNPMIDLSLEHNALYEILSFHFTSGGIRNTTGTENRKTTVAWQTLDGGDR